MLWGTYQKFSRGLEITRPDQCQAVKPVKIAYFKISPHLNTTPHNRAHNPLNLINAILYSFYIALFSIHWLLHYYCIFLFSNMKRKPYCLETIRTTLAALHYHLLNSVVTTRLELQISQ